MNVRDLLATVSLVVGAMAGCAARAGEGEPPEEALAEDEPLDVVVDSLDIVHGALRISAVMVDGAADVSLRLGGDCEHREVGGGISTPSTLVWSLGDSDLAKAIACGLVVRARVRDGARYIRKFADLGVMVEMAAQDPENADDGPQLQTVTTSAVGIRAVFARVTRRTRLTTPDSILAAVQPVSDEAQPATGDDTGRFIVPHLDFARSLLGGRPLYVDGSSFTTSLSLAGTSLRSEPTEEPDEEGSADQG